MFDLTYDELYRAADILWPGEAEDILNDPTDAQLMLILASLTKVPAAPLWWSAGEPGVALSTLTTNTTSL